MREPINGATPRVVVHPRWRDFQNRGDLFHRQERALSRYTRWVHRPCWLVCLHSLPLEHSSTSPAGVCDCALNNVTGAPRIVEVARTLLALVTLRFSRFA